MPTAHDYGSNAEYSVAPIEALSGLEAIRRRPGMYVGDVRDGSALYRVLVAAVGSALFRARSERRVAIDVVLQLDGSVSIVDDAPPFSVARVPNGVGGAPTAIERWLTLLHCRTEFVPEHHVFAFNALSRTFEVIAHDGGRRHVARYARGVCTQPLTPTGRSERRGTELHALLDDTIFSGVTRYSVHALAARLRTLAASCPNARITLKDRRTGVSLALQYPRGMADLLEEFDGGRAVLFADAFHVRVGAPDARRNPQTRARSWPEADTVVEFAVRASCSAGLAVHGVVNGVAVARGAHITGFLHALRQLLAGYADVKRAGLAYCPLTAVVSVTMPYPTFGRATGDTLLDPEVRALVRRAMLRQFGAFLAARPDDARRLAQHAVVFGDDEDA